MFMMTTSNELNLSVRKHAQPNSDGSAILGQKYSIIIECAGHVFHEPTRFGDDERIKRDIDSVKNAIRTSKIAVKY
jgi:hypothetical protein